MSLVDALKRNAILKERARYMRANPTDAEQRLWSILRNKRLAGLRWKRQQVIDDRYIVDFICFEYRLIVEADGSQHHESESDVRRDEYLKAECFQMLRFWNKDILINIKGIGESILAAVETIAAQVRDDPTPNPLPQGEGARESSTNVQL